MLFEMHQYDIKICHYNLTVFAVYNSMGNIASMLKYLCNSTPSDGVNVTR